MLLNNSQTPFAQACRKGYAGDSSPDPQDPKQNNPLSGSGAMPICDDLNSREQINAHWPMTYPLSLIRRIPTKAVDAALDTFLETRIMSC